MDKPEDPLHSSTEQDMGDCEDYADIDCHHILSIAGKIISIVL